MSRLSMFGVIPFCVGSVVDVLSRGGWPRTGRSHSHLSPHFFAADSPASFTAHAERAAAWNADEEEAFGDDLGLWVLWHALSTSLAASSRAASVESLKSTKAVRKEQLGRMKLTQAFMKKRRLIEEAERLMRDSLSLGALTPRPLLPSGPSGAFFTSPTASPAPALAALPAAPPAAPPALKRGSGAEGTWEATGKEPESAGTIRGCEASALDL